MIPYLENMEHSKSKIQTMPVHYQASVTASTNTSEIEHSNDLL